MPEILEVPVTLEQHRFEGFQTGICRNYVTREFSGALIIESDQTQVVDRQHPPDPQPRAKRQRPHPDEEPSGAPASPLADRAPGYGRRAHSCTSRVPSVRISPTASGISSGSADIVA